MRFFWPQAAPSPRQISIDNPTFDKVAFDERAALKKEVAALQQQLEDQSQSMTVGSVVSLARKVHGPTLSNKRRDV